MRVPALVAAIPLAAGAAAGVQLSERVDERVVFAAAAAATLALIAGLAFLSDDEGWGVCAAVVIGCALAGYSLGAAHDRTFRTASLLAWFDSTIGAAMEPVIVEGVLREDAAAGAFGVILALDAEEVIAAGQRARVHGGIRISVAGNVPAQSLQKWRAGRTLRMPLLLRRPVPFRNPGVPDETQSLARRGIVLLGSVKSAALVEVLQHGGPIEEFAAETRAWTRTVIPGHVGRRNPASSALALSILIGDRSGLAQDDERRLQDAGIYHVIAISGGNIAILTAILLACARALRVPQRAAALASIVVLLFYGEVAGGSPSVGRAVTAAVVFLFALALDHRGAPLNTVGVAAIAGIAVLPTAIVDAGFLLSFGATAAIILGVPRLMTPLARSRWIVRATASLVAATVCAELAIAPVTASYFSRLTAAGLVVNFAAIPLMTVVQAGSMLLLALSTVSLHAADVTGSVVSLAAAALLDSSRFVDWVPWLARDVSPPAWWICVLYYVACIAVLLRPSRPRMLLTALTATCLVASPGFTARSELPSVAAKVLRIVVLDVGQGDATAVLFPDGSGMLVDAGGLLGTSFDIGGRVVLPALRALRLSRLHALVLTHGDPDHIGGASAILERLRPASVWEGVPVPPHAGLTPLIANATASGIPWRTVQPGDVQRIGEVEIRILHPPVPDWERQRVRNDDSVVVDVRYGDVSVLLPGDIGAGIERQLIAGLTPARVRILKAAHHGSATSSSEEFLDALAPDAVIFSSGKNNRFAHPATLVVERFARRGIPMFNTADDGAVFVETDGKEVEVWGWTARTRRLTLSRPTAAGAEHDDTTIRRHGAR